MAKIKTAPRIVYVAELKKLREFSKGDQARVRKLNPEVRGGTRPVLYVGETGLCALERYLQHLLKYKSQRAWIHKYGVRLVDASSSLIKLPGLTEATKRQIYHLARPLRTDSKVREAEVARLLREAGYYVVSA